MKFSPLAIIVCFVMSLVLSGCGGGNSSNDNQVSPALPAPPSIVSTNSIETSRVATDGQWLAWIAREPGGVMYDDGTNLFNLTEGLSLDVIPYAAQLDDRYVVFITSNTGEIYVVDTQSSDLTPQLISANINGITDFDLNEGIVVWVGEVNNEDEIFYCDLTSMPLTPVQVTDDQTFKIQCKIDQGLIVWSGNVPGVIGGYKEIFYYDLNAAIPTITQASTTGGYDDWMPDVDDGLIVWQGPGGNDVEVFYYDLTATSPGVVQLTNNTTDDREPKVDNRIITWSGYDGDTEVYYIDLNATSPAVTKLTNDTANDYSPKIADGVIFWIGYGTGDYEVYYYDLNATVPEIVTVTDNTLSDSGLHGDGNFLLWKQIDTDGEHVLTHDLSSGVTTTLSVMDNQEVMTPYSGVNQLSEGRSVWVSKGLNRRIFALDPEASTDPVAVSPADIDVRDFVLDNGCLAWNISDGNDTEIYMLDLNAAEPSIVQLTDNMTDDEDVKIKDGIIVWHGDDNDNDEIFYYDLEAVAPAVVQVTSSTEDQRDPQTDGRFIVWVSSNQIYYCDLDAASLVPTMLTDGLVPDERPVISDGITTWLRENSDDTLDVYYADLTAPTPSVQRISDNDSYVGPLAISDGLIAWADITSYITSSVSNLYYYDLQATPPTVKLLATSDLGWLSPTVSNGVIVWDEYDDSVSPDSEIYSYSPRAASPTVRQITDNDVGDDSGPQYRDGYYIWRVTGQMTGAYGFGSSASDGGVTTGTGL